MDEANISAFPNYSAYNIIIFLTYTEGFLAGTLIKTTTGYIAIEDISPGDYVLCFDDQCRLVERPVIFIAKKQSNRYLCLMMDDELICVAYDQKLLRAVNNEWITAHELHKADLLEGIETDHAIVSMR